MATWIHFTEDIEEFINDDFELSLEQFEDDELNSFADEGLFVHKFHADFPVEERSAAWGGRQHIIIECDESHVELIQEDPTGDDPDNDEYMIPCDAFQHCKIR